MRRKTVGNKVVSVLLAGALAASLAACGGNTASRFNCRIILVGQHIRCWHKGRYKECRNRNRSRYGGEFRCSSG